MVEVMSDNILKLDVKKQADRTAPIKLAETRYDKCRHHHVEVDPKLELLTCLDCKERLSPIAYIVGVAEKIRGWEHELERITKARAELSKRIATKCTFCGKMTKINI